MSKRPVSLRVLARTLLAVTALTTVACASSDGETRIIEVYGEPADLELGLAVDSCEATEIITRVDERMDEISILVSTRGADDGPDCVDAATVQLNEPLGSRIVIDESTGKAVEISSDG